MKWIGKIIKDEYRKGTNLLDIEILDKPLTVLTYAKMIHEREENTNTVARPYGRKDYQLLYIKKGFIEVTFDNKPIVYGKNTLFLIKPNVPNFRRILIEKEKCVCLYIHFSGSDAENILNKYGITQAVMKFDEDFEIFEEILNRMDAGRNSSHYSELCDLLFQELLIYLSDYLKQKEITTHKGFNKILKLMDLTCHENYPIKFYADQIHFSEVYFIRFFKKAMGVSPHKYLMIKKLEKALPLLLYSEDSIKVISEKLGFSNQHYFSKVFYDKYRISPSEYRNSKK
ncbi:MAG: helix-turn-helix domain-containing protein [Ruminococcaceae bacterium]|nr:helix-turn-helix domain-containing protein [Oscillospiraceae bacterium]